MTFFLGIASSSSGISRDIERFALFRNEAPPFTFQAAVGQEVGKVVIGAIWNPVRDRLFPRPALFHVRRGLDPIAQSLGGVAPGIFNKLGGKLVALPFIALFLNVAGGVASSDKLIDGSASKPSGAKIHDGQG